MATPNVGILTNSGKNLIDQVNAGKTKITFSKIVFSSMDNSKLTDDQVKALTAITPQEVVVNSPEATLDANTGETRIRATGNNEALTDGVYVKTYAVYAKDDSGNEVLYGITVSPNPNYFPEYDGVTPQAVTYSYKVNISNTSNITFTNSDDIYVSDTDLAEALQPYAKTVDVNQQLDTKVKISDMRKPASDVAGIEEVNAKQDKIGYTPADDSKVLHNSGLATMPNDNLALVVGKNGDIGLVKQRGYSGAFGVGAGNSFHVVQSNHNSIGIADTFHDMFKINGNYQISLGPGAYFTPADDSKVVHTTGDEEIADIKIFDTAPIDKTTGHHYITDKSLTIVYAGIPSLAVDGAGKYTITAPKNADIAHITDYTLYYRVKGTGDFTQVALTPDKLTGTVDLSKVTTATNFESYATATNVFGESDPSSMVQWSYDPAKASSTPPSLTISDDGTYTITEPATTPTPIVKYFLYYNVDGQSDITKLDVGTQLTGSLKVLIAKPDKTTTYDVQATAMNANAESGVSNSVKFTYVPIDGSIYGASWDRKISPTLTRTDAAVGLKAGINGAQNDFDNVGPWKGMHRVTDIMGNVFVRVPKFYIRKTQTGNSDNGTATWQVSLVSHGDDWYLPKGFWDFTNSKELDYIDIGAYDATGSSSKLTSVAGKAPLVSLSIVNFRSAAKANGTGYQIWDIHANDMLQVLFIIEFATLNSQSIMEGVDTGSSSANSGSADSHKGSSGTAGSGSNAMSYRGIENLYGNVWQFCDGVNFKNNQPWVCEDATKYQSDLFAAPYVSTSYSSTSDGYIKALAFDSAHPYAQFATDASGSESTYYTDYDYPGSGNTILETGGGWGNGAFDGLFYSYRGGSSTDAAANGGCRLLKKALP